MLGHGQRCSELHYPANTLSRPSNQSPYPRSLSRQRSTASENSALYNTPAATGRRSRPLPPVPHPPRNLVTTDVWRSPSMPRQSRPLPLPPCYRCATSAPPLRRAVSLPRGAGLVPNSSTMVSMVTRKHMSNSLSVVPVTYLSQPPSRVLSLSSITSSTSEPRGTIPNTPFSKGCFEREGRTVVVPNDSDLPQPHSVQRVNPSPTETTSPTEIVSPTKSQHPGLASQSCIPRRQRVPSPAALATVTETPRRSERKRPPALTIHIPSSTLSSFLTEASSSESGQSSPPLTPRTPPSPSVLRRRRFSKLRRQFGDAPPAAMVFGSELGADESSKPNMPPCADAPATPLQLPTKKWVWDKGGRRRTASDYSDVIRYLREL
ncbi:hypothetical protein F5J12DRAFT_520974 [Pisolithus orientalis]|uniref:uncharacterized protein n=1 Tax=Pisolithus orientalis TaxID=936130 RepID=UPI002224BFD9|nr:uncharacterized protein F5J12DRAFT_520974 [Pisolithus orientalis]KAI6015190.1 hypothetical protein F5J12DRAFT_520974 [Pisolithus orientalis]